MKKGDVVTIQDGSYTRSVIAGKLVREWLNYGNEIGKEYTIIEVNCVFPTVGNQSYFSPRFNNTVIQAIDSGKVVFIEENFLCLKHTKPVPIREVTMAEVCVQFGEDVKIIRKF